jgi:hypothetical protein
LRPQPWRDGGACKGGGGAALIEAIHEEELLVTFIADDPTCNLIRSQTSNMTLEESHTRRNYQHRALADAGHDIRLLKILDASAESGSIQCQLTNCPRDEAPAYTAISYTWGDFTSRCSITIGDELMFAGQNCAYAISQAFHFDQSRFYWIDSICINQRNDQEKAEQVAMMGDIFHQADLVLSCIGPHSDGSESFFSFATGRSESLQKLAYRTNFHTAINSWCPQTIKESFYFWKWLVHTTMNSTTRRAVCKAAKHLVKRSYFKRAWIMQEVALARDILICCGMDTCDIKSWRGLVSFVYFDYAIAWKPTQLSPDRRFLGSLNHKAAWVSEAVFQASRDRSTDFQEFSEAKHDNFLPLAADHSKHYLLLTELLRVMPHMECTDPRDRIYAALQLIYWDDDEPIRPDYSCSTEYLALEVISHLIRQSGQGGKLEYNTINNLILALRLDRTEILRASMPEPTLSASCFTKCSIIARGCYLTETLSQHSSIWRRSNRDCLHRSRDPNQRQPSAGRVMRTEVLSPFAKSSFAIKSERMSVNMTGRRRGSFEGAEWAISIDWLSSRPNGIFWSLVVRRKTSGEYAVCGHMLLEEDVDEWDHGEAFTLSLDPSKMLKLAIVSRQFNSEHKFTSDDRRFRLAQRINSYSFIDSLHESQVWKMHDGVSKYAAIRSRIAEASDELSE